VDFERQKELPNRRVPQLAARFQRRANHVYYDLGEWRRKTSYRLPVRETVLIIADHSLRWYWVAY